MDNYDWNALTGKKILVFDPDFKKVNTPVIQTMEIEGCDPDIGVCITYLSKEPYWIAKGPLAPNKVKNGVSKEVLTLIYNQLRSGYFSALVVEGTIEEIDKSYVDHSLIMDCPFSM